MPKGVKGFQKGHKKIGGKKKGTENRKTTVKQKAEEAIEEAKTEALKTILGAKEEMQDTILEKLEPLLKAELDLALGTKTYRKIKDRKTGEVVSVWVYDIAPQQRAIEYLIDRVYGRPKEHVKVDEENPLKRLIIEIQAAKQPVVNPDSKMADHSKPKKDEPVKTTSATKPQNYKPITTREDLAEALADE